MTEPRPLEIAFVIEQVLGHITHAGNLRARVPDHPHVRPHWVLPTFETSATASRVPVYRSNWTVRAGLHTRRALKRINATTNLDALFFHTQTPAMLCPDWVRRVPTVISMDATPLQYDELGTFYDHAVGSGRVETFKTRVTTARYAGARRLVTWSEWAKQSLVDDYAVTPERVEVIPPGVTLADWASPARTFESPGPVRLLFVGGDFERKGGLHLIEAFRSLHDLDVELHIVTRDQVSDVERVVVHRGIAPNSPELRRLYAESDIFVLPTLGDCLPMVFIEAGAAGLTTIATRIAAIPEIVRNDETGILTQPGDVRALSDALRRLINRPSERILMGERATAHVSRHYDDETNTATLVQLLEDITRETPEQEDSSM